MYLFISLAQKTDSVFLKMNRNSDNTEYYSNLNY